MKRIQLLLVLWLLSAPFLAAEDKAKTLKPEESAQYAGSEVCLTCHDNVYKKQFEGTPHFQTVKKNGHGCESCHGPGAAHVAAGGDKTKILRFSEMSPEDASRRCLECHGNAHSQRHFGGSAHASNGVGCLDCHNPHHAKEERGLLREAEPELCYGCHASTRAEFARPYRHRVEEGLLKCSDCHDAHGTGALRQIRSTPGGDAVCYKCHADKQGPFLYEHMPVKTEGCGSCHTPHGSTNPRMLRVAQVNLLCLQCHSAPALGPSGPAHNQSQKYQACTMCHPAIHGSNSSSVLMQ